jgi:hypothetical protein
MKAILFTGALLMVGASIYGFIDYRDSAGKKSFKSLYSAEKPNSASAVETKKEAEVSSGNFTPVKTARTKEVRVEGKESEPLTYKKDVTPVETIKETLETKAVTVKDEKARSKSSKKKKVKTKMFSRGAIDRPQEFEPVAETKKLETKSKE